MRYIKKSNDLIMAKFSLSANEQRMILYVVSKIKKSDTAFKNYDISITELINAAGISKARAYSECKQIAKNLLSKPICIHMGKSELICNWLSSCEIDKETNTISCCFDPKLKPFLLQLKKCFTAYKLENTTGFKSKWAFRIYEICKQYEPLGTRIMSVMELKSSLDILDKYENKISMLKKKVINPAIKDINEHSDLLVSVEYIKKYRKIDSIVFDIKRKDQAIKCKPEIAPSEASDQPGIDPKTVAAAEKTRRLKKIWDDMTDEEKAEFPNGFIQFKVKSIAGQLDD